MDLTIHHTHPKIVLGMAKNHMLKIMRLKKLVQGLQSVGLFHQLTDKKIYKQVSNIQIELYLMRSNCF